MLMREMSLRAHLRVIEPVGNTVRFGKVLQRWRAFRNTVSDLNGLKFEPKNSCSTDERVIARPTGRYSLYCNQLGLINLLEYF